MSEISKIKLQNGEEFNLKDSQVRYMLDVLLGKVLPVESQNNKEDTDK